MDAVKSASRYIDVKRRAKGTKTPITPLLIGCSDRAGGILSEESKQFEYFWKLAYTIASQLVDSHEDRQDLAQVVALKYHLNRQNITAGKELAWIRATARNAARDYLRKKKDPAQAALNFDDLENMITEQALDTNDDKSPETMLAEYGINLSRPERQILDLYARSSFQIKKLAKRRQMSYETLKKKVYRLKADIRAAHNRNQGMLGSRLIVGAKLNENLLNFMKTLSAAIENNTLESMSIYFYECEIPLQPPSIDIQKVIDYDIHLLADNTYRIYATYEDKQAEIKFFITEFKIYNENSIKITDFPRPPSKVIALDESSLPPEVLKQLKERDKGIPKLSDEELNELLLKHGLLK